MSSIQQRVEQLEQSVGWEADAIDCQAVRAAILDLLEPQNIEIVEALRAAAMVEDCKFALKSQIVERHGHAN